MINFDDARVLSYNHQHVYLGDNLNYGIQKHLVVEGSIYALSNQAGVQPVWSGIQGMVTSATDYDAISINGLALGAGRVNNINFEQGNDVRKKNYSVDITVFATGNLFNMVGSNFNGISLPNIHLVEKFDESFDFSITENNTYTYKQTVNVQYIQGGIIADPMTAAKQLASGLISSTPPYGFVDGDHSGLYNTPGRRTYAESYNKITNECSFTENFTENVPSGNYSIKYTQNLSTDENGISTVTEDGEIIGLLGPDYFGSAMAGLTFELTQVYGRSETTLHSYVPNALNLNTSYLSLKKALNNFTNTINYNVQFGNDPRFQTTYSWDYTQELSRGTDTCFYEIKENGTVKGINCSKDTQYANALAGWAIVNAAVASRISGYYQTSTSLNNPLRQLTSTQRFAPLQGAVAYNYNYTDDLTYHSDQTIKRTDIEIKDDVSTPVINTFQVAHVGEIAQNFGLPKEARRLITMKMLGKRGTALSIYLASAQANINNLLPVGNDIFVNSCSYTLTPNDNVFNFNLEWIYFTPATSLFV